MPFVDSCGSHRVSQGTCCQEGFSLVYSSGRGCVVVYSMWRGSLFWRERFLLLCSPLPPDMRLSNSTTMHKLNLLASDTQRCIYSCPSLLGPVSGRVPIFPIKLRGLLSVNATVSSFKNQTQRRQTKLLCFVVTVTMNSLSAFHLNHELMVSDFLTYQYMILKELFRSEQWQRNQCLI